MGCEITGFEPGAAGMTWEELNEARGTLGLTEGQMARLLRVGLSTYTGWAGKDVRRKPGPPDYIAASVEAHMLLSARALDRLKSQRGIQP